MMRTFEFAVVLIVLAVGWLAAPRPALAQDARNRELQALVNDTAFQLKLTNRHSPRELEKRYGQLNEAVAAWNASARSAADDRRLEEWLRAAIGASMPGSSSDLPAVPRFEPKPQPQAPRRRTAPEELPSPSTRRDRAVTPAGGEARAPAAPTVSPVESSAAESTAPAAAASQPMSEAGREEQTLLRPTSVPATSDDDLDFFADDLVTTSESSEPTSASESDTAEPVAVESVEDFWNEHPAGDELPADLSSGDPFVDDPLP